MYLFYGALGIVIEAGTTKIVKTAVKNILAGENLSKLQKLTTGLATVGISSWVAASSTMVVRNSIEEGVAQAKNLLSLTGVETQVESQVETQVESQVETQVEESSSDE